MQKTIEDIVGLDLAKANQYTVGQGLDVWFENYAKLKVRPSSPGATLTITSSPTSATSRYAN